MGSEIRIGQLVAPFGPGSIYTDKNGVPNIICGLDYWYHKKKDGQYTIIENALKKCEISEPRLSILLKVSRFRQPPDYHFDKDDKDLSNLAIQGHRFPRWYVDNKTGQLRQFNLETMQISPRGSWRPVRFITVCQHGHIGDFPWKQWIGCTCHNNDGLQLHDAGGADLSSIRVKCIACQNGKSLSGSTTIHRDDAGNIESTGLKEAGIDCHSERPWLGASGKQLHCTEPLTCVLINQSNVYFARTMSSIFLPDLVSTKEITAVQDCLWRDEEAFNDALVKYRVGKKNRCLQILKNIVSDHFNPIPDDDIIFDAFDKLCSGQSDVADTISPAVPDTDLLAFRRAEYNVLRNEILNPQCAELRILSAIVPTQLQQWFSRVNLVEKLRETKVFFGFDRLVKPSNPLAGMPDTALEQLFLDPPPQGEEWLPAVKNFGEGIYLELSEPSVNKWLATNESWLCGRYDANFIGRMATEPMLLPPAGQIHWLWAARYQLVHTLAHVLINQLVFECGYSSASLKERIYVSADTQAPMAAILIYTASSDSEGSLGGLVRLGRSQHFEPLVRRAISRASWCSADPVCSENLGGSGSRLVNMAACHACVLLPETACETINNGLDRATVVGTPDNPDTGFLSSLLKETFVL